jgi:MFS-type transporter involved in bile tolerance (Atg22 family)
MKRTNPFIILLIALFVSLVGVIAIGFLEQAFGADTVFAAATIAALVCGLIVPFIQLAQWRARKQRAS